MQQLLHRYMEGTATTAETQWLMEAITRHTNPGYWEDLLEPLAANDAAEPVSAPQQWEEILQAVFSQTPTTAVECTDKPKQRLGFLLSGKWRAAAAIIILMASGTYFLLHKKAVAPPVLVHEVVPVKDVAPGGNKAVLTLADGTQVELDSTQQGTLAQQGNMKVLQLKGGRLTYQGAQQAQSGAALQYNTLATPKGGQFVVTLPDGTLVWLNAASSLRYPTSFAGGERRVELTGEGYFEVTKDPARPFYVQVQGMEVAVLGTHFNVMAYADEGIIKTTLLSGAVKVTHGHSSAQLLPGQQAGLPATAAGFTVKPADIEQVMAWKNGLLSLEDADVPAVMRQIARWYNVDIRYEGPVPERRFIGAISRQVNLSAILKALEINNVHCRMEGREIIVTP
ncbi:FecR domain-containing protein [Chitinophaga sp. MM2321]|uniref:FecR family protein n=1 Tax=Chitinophaga sp. MM2321 TaxID=3137178 RepID=UPI0032D59FCB